MLFSSNVFLFLFLPVALIGYQVASRFGRTAMLLWLTASSLFFYGYWNPKYLILLVGSMLMNYLFSRMLVEGRSERSRSRWLVASIVCNILLLVYFKYLFPVLGFLHAHGSLSYNVQNIILPLGISFFTFTQIAYLIDLRQGIAKHQGLVPYSVFVTVFPHLIAGPIIHPRELMPQLEEGRIRGLQLDEFTLGVSWFVMGLGKKVLIADRIAPVADLMFAHPHDAGMSTTWVGALAYAMQLYFDFSGYSDMALGLARMFNLRFPINFNSPFKSQGVIEYWTRWHMTLSRYLNEYLYTPTLRYMSGRRMDAGKKANMKAAATPSGFFDMVFIPSIWTMGIAGIWHGAGLQFLCFGLLHGVYLCINHAWRFLTPRKSPWHDRVPVPFLVGLNFLAVLVGFVFFRAASTRDALYILGNMAGLHGAGPAYASNPWVAELPTIAKFLHSIKGCAVSLAICFFIVWALPNTQEMLDQLPKDGKRSASLLPRLFWRPSVVWSLGLTAVLCLSILMLDAGANFLYFQF